MQKLNGKEDRNAFKATWEIIQGKLEDADFDLDSMLNTYLYYKLSANPKSRLDKELLSIFKKESKESNVDALKIIQEISDFSEAYIKTLNEENKYLYCLRYLTHRIYWESILSTALFTKYPHITELKELLVVYYYQHWVAGATAARIKQTSFNILKLVKSGKPISAISEEMKKHLTKHNTTETFKEAIDGNGVSGKKWAKAILLLIEYFSSDNIKVSYIPINKKLHLEHVLPQTPNDDWESIFSQAECDEWTDSLANLTLLSGRKNSQAQNYSYPEKMKVYGEKDKVTSSFLITQDIIKCEKWGIEELEKRKKHLRSKIMDKLDIF